MFPQHTTIAIAMTATLVMSANSVAQMSVDFNRDIRPILSDKCFQCHGPDSASREADLRLDIATDANENAFVPGNLESSEAWQRILSDDPDTIMPPPHSHKELSESEKSLIQRWIQSGAKYQQHWAFQKVTAPPIPEVAESRFAGSAIDRFVYQTMQKKNLQPSPKAERIALIRRATLDLTGLPPTLKDIDAFLADKSPNAFEKVIDRLLASPHYGERMAVDWMDVARYGDTSVFHADGPRDMWKWRDWVVQAYNDNLPYDQFSIKQLAGDLVPEKTVEDHLASGFNRNNASTDEGGAIAEEFRVEYAVDRVKTTSMVWMGLSMECAQCHDHKYDPISQHDYYRFFAFFNQAADPGMQTRNGNQAPIVNIQDPQKLAQVPGLEKERAELTQKIADLKASQQTAFGEWLSDDRLAEQTEEIPADTVAWFDFDKEQKKDIKNQSNADDQVTLSGNAKLPEGKFGRAIRTRGNQFLSSRDTAKDFAGDTPISYGCWVQMSGGQNGAPIARMDDGNAYVGFDLFLQGDGVAAHLIHKWPENAVKVIAKKKLEKGKWHHLFVTYDGSQKADGFKIYVDGTVIESKPSHNSLTGITTTTVPFKIGRRHNSSQFDGLVDDVRVYDRVLSATEVATIAQADPLPGLLGIAESERTDAQKKQLFEIFLERQVPEHGQLTEKVTKLASRIKGLQAPVTTVMVMQDQPKPRMTYVLNRGQYDSPDKEQPVQPGVPEFLPSFESYPPNRLGMARWLMSKDHPLTARVTVNRIWRTFFGIGIVESIEDFGFQGTWPSHPALLDWLAHDFVESGWDTKRLIKMIMMSETYQQSSVVTQNQMERDPQNRYLSRSPRMRLAGEFLRDQALAISGLLNQKIGGPGVKPYQPDGLWNEVSLNGNLRFRRDSGDKLYRKSLYTYWKRSAPPPNMVIFDAPTREKCTVRRGKTNTPLQALVLMNDPQFVEAARVFAQRIIREGGANTEDRIRFAVRMCVSREPTSDEVAVLRQVLETERQTFTEQSERAEKLLSVGEKQRDASLDAAEVAAWTVLCNLLFNLDEFVTRG